MTTQNILGAAYQSLCRSPQAVSWVSLSSRTVLHQTSTQAAPSHETWLSPAGLGLVTKSLSRTVTIARPVNRAFGTILNLKGLFEVFTLVWTASVVEKDVLEGS